MQRVLQSWLAHESYKIQSLAQDDDGNLLSVGSDSSVRLWSTTNYSLRRTWAGVHARKSILVPFRTDATGIACVGKSVFSFGLNDGIVKHCTLY